MRTEKRRVGDWGEDIACSWLSRAGYRVAERNYRARGGEIDIVAWRKHQGREKTLCFIEVKTRSGEDGSAERATDWQKIRRLMNAATHYCLARGIARDATPIQFEQVSVYVAQNNTTRCRHYVLPIN